MDRRKASHASLKLPHERNITNNVEWTFPSGFGVNKMQQQQKQVYFNVLKLTKHNPNQSTSNYKDL
jgi:hypothetical protein